MKKLILLFLTMLPLLSMGQLSFKELFLKKDLISEQHKVYLKLDIKFSGLEDDGVGLIILLGMTKSDKKFKDWKWKDQPTIRQWPKLLGTINVSAVFEDGRIFIISNKN